MVSHAIIGCGRVAQNHIVAAQFAGVATRWLCDLDIRKARALAASHFDTRTTTHIDEILADQEVRTVSICTDHGSHHPLTIRALRAGKHVLVEKPIATTVEAGAEMIETAHERDLILAVVSQQRFNPVIRAVHTLVQAGALGDIALASGFLQCSKTREYYQASGWRGTHSKEGGSTLINQAIHTLDLMAWILGVPRCVSASQSRTRFDGIIETEDSLVALLKFPQGALGTLSSSNCSSIHWSSYIELVGSAGSIGFGTGFPVRVHRFSVASEEGKRWQDELAALQDEDQQLLPPTQSYYGVSHNQQFKNFIDAIDGRGDLQFSPLESLRTLEVVQEIYFQARKQAEPCME